MSVTLLEVMAAASERVAPLTGECAGYVVLAAADQLAMGPRVVAAQNVSIEESGAVRLRGGAAAEATECERSLRQLLDELMLLARNGSAALLRAGRRQPAGDLEQLVKELEVALIPANRAAAGRSLARLHRETVRAIEAGGRVRACGGDEQTTGVVAVPESVPRAAPPERVSFEAPGPVVVEQAPLEEIEVDVELEAALSPAAPPAGPFSQVPDEPVLMSDSACVEFETPTEPVVRRQATRRLAPESPDIHKTPYLGTLVAPTTEASAAPAWASALGSHQQGTPASESAIEDEGATTDPMPQAEEWLESEELEEVASIEALAWPEPDVADRAVPPAPRRFAPPESDVRDLIARFGVAEPEPTAQLLRGLTELAGLSATPPPVAAGTPAAGADERKAGGPAARELEPLQPLEPLRTVTITGSG